MRPTYPSDVTREQFEQIRHHLESAKKITKPRQYELYDIFCAVLYVVREGCRWRSLPHDLPKWQNCYKHYAAWKERGADGTSILDKALAELVLFQRVINGRTANPSLGITDAKSVKNAFCAKEKGYDAGKKYLE
jgi:transposase